MIELWVIFALVSALLMSFSSIINKKVLLEEHAMEFATVLSMFVFILSLPIFFFVDYASLDLGLLGILYGGSVLASIAILYTAKGVRHMEISESMPLATLGPGITALFALIFLGEYLTGMQVSGIFLLVAGSYILELNPKKDLLYPLRVFKRSKYIHYVLLALFLYGLTSVIDRYLLSVKGFDSLTYLAFANMFVFLNFLVMISFCHNGVDGIKNGINRAGWWIFLVGIFVVAYRFAAFEAVKIAPAVGLVVAIRRMSALITTFVGGEVFHDHHLLRKVLACLVMVFGAILVVL